MGLAAGSGLALGPGAVPPAVAQPQGGPQAAGRQFAPITIQVRSLRWLRAHRRAGPFDAWKLAGHLGASIETRLVALNDALEVTALDGVRVQRTAPFSPFADILVVPGAPAVVRSGQLPAGARAAADGVAERAQDARHRVHGRRDRGPRRRPGRAQRQLPATRRTS